jgi:hypothetical protein
MIRTGIRSLALLFIAFPLLAAGQGKTPSAVMPAHAPVPQSYEQYAVYWTAEAGWKTEIHLRNNLPAQALTVTPVLRATDGTERALPNVTISPNDLADVDVVAAITSAAPQLEGEYGSLVLRYTAPVERALSAAVMIQLPGTPIEVHLDAFPKAPRAMTGGREGIWWLARESVTDWLVLANTSGSSLTALLTLYEFDGKSLRKKLTLGPRQTTRLSVLSLVKQGGLVGSFGGISIDAGPRAADFDSAHFMYDEANGFLALMKMFDRDSDAAVGQRSLTNLQWTIRAPMLPLTSPDPALGLPAGTTLKPAVFLRNASSNAYTAKVTFNWRWDKITGKRMLAVPLQPHATARLDVAALQAKGTIPASAQWAYVNITAPIKPDDLLAVATSFDSTLRIGAQTPFTDQTANHWAGAMWEVDPNHDTLIAVGNAGDTALRARITFYYDSGQSKYLLERTLAPDEQAWIDVNQLITNQIPDVKGKTIPPSVMTGSYELNSVTDKLTDGLFEGKLIVNKTYGYAVHGCQTCCPEYDERWLVEDPLNLLIGGSNTQSAWGINACNGNTVQMSALSWDTLDHQVATADNTGRVTAAGVGSTTDFASVRNFAPNSRGYCSWSTVPTDGTVNVVQTCPTSTSVAKLDAYSVAVLFPSIKTGIGAISTMQVAPSTPNNTPIFESLVPGSSTCPTSWGNLCQGVSTPFSVGQGGQGSVFINGQRLYFGPVYVGQGNTFYDQHSIANSTSLLDSSGIQTCTATCSQTYSCNGLPVGTHALTYTFIKALINGTHVTDTEVSKQ